MINLFTLKKHLLKKNGEPNLEFLEKLLLPYEKTINEYENEIIQEIQNANNLIETCLKYPAWLGYIHSRYSELKTISLWLESIQEEIYAKIYKAYTENYDRGLTHNEKLKYVQGHKDVVKINQAGIHVEEYLHRLEGILETIKNASYMLGHVTKLRITDLEEKKLNEA